jgi:hypothetical protein
VAVGEPIRSNALSNRLFGGLAAATVAIALAIPLTTGAIVSAVCDFGGDARISLYETFAEISPVLALAAFVEQAILVSDRVDKSATDYYKLVAGGTIRVQAALLVLLEAAAFYAIGTGESTTFLLVTCLATLAIQVLSLANLSLGRAGLKRIGRASTASETVEDPSTHDSPGDGNASAEEGSPDEG